MEELLDKVYNPDIYFIMLDTLIQIFKNHITKVNLYLCLMSAQGLKPLVHEHTRETATGRTTIDNVFMNYNISNYVLHKTYMSDYKYIELELNNIYENHEFCSIFRRMFSTANKTVFMKMFEEDKWVDLYTCKKSVDGNFKIFITKRNKYYNIAFPIKNRIISK